LASIFDDIKSKFITSPLKALFAPDNYETSDTFISVIKDIYQKLAETKKTMEGKQIIVHEVTKEETIKKQEIIREVPIAADELSLANLKSSLITIIGGNLSDLEKKLNNTIVVNDNYYYSEAAKAARIDSFNYEIDFNELATFNKNINVLGTITGNTITDGTATLTGGVFTGLTSLTSTTGLFTHASISDDLTIGGDDISFINGVASISSTLWVGGAPTFLSDLIVSGTASSTFAGMLDIEGDVNIGGNDLYVDASSGNVGIGTTSPTANITIGPSTSGVFSNVDISAFDSDSRKWNETIANFTNTIGSRKNVTKTWGYNQGSGGSPLDLTDHAFYVQMENYYYPSEGSVYPTMEYHLNAYGANNAWNVRPFQFNVSRADGWTVGSFNFNRLTFQDATVGQVMKMEAGVMNLYSDFYLRKVNNNQPILKQMNAAGTSYIEVIRVNENNQVQIAGGGGESVFGGNVGIGDTSPGYKLSVDGTASISDNFYLANDMLWSSIANDTLYSSSSWQIGGNFDVDGTASISSLTINGAVYSNNGTLTNVDPSSELYKHDVNPVDLNAERLYGLQLKSFAWNTNNQLDFGLIAEDIKSILPEIYSEQNGITGYKSDHLAFYLLELAQKQEKEIEGLKASLSLNALGMIETDVKSAFDETFINRISSLIKDVLEKLGLFIENGVASVKKLIADEAKINRLQVDRFEMKEKETGDIYCIWMGKGELQKQKGECSEIDNQPEPAQTATEPVIEPSVEPEDITSNSELPIIESPSEEPTQNEEPIIEEPVINEEPAPVIEEPVINSEPTSEPAIQE